MSNAVNQKVDCKVYDLPDGAKHLVFTIQGTGQCVGELRIVTMDERYLLVISQLFSAYAAQRRGPRAVAADVRKLLNLVKG